MNKRLLHILNQDFDVSKEAFEEAQQSCLEQNAILAETLIKKQVVTENQLLEAYSKLYNIPFLPKIFIEAFDTTFTQHISIQFLKKYSMVPVKTTQVLQGLTKTPDENILENDAQEHAVLVINDPSLMQPLDDVIKILKWDDVDLVLSTRDAILSLINNAYDSSRDTAQQLVEDMEENANDIISEIEETSDLLDDTSDAPIIKLVNHIISQSVKSGASDIHIEPYQNSFKIRYRVDGVLYDLLTPPKWMQPSLISRIKVMAKMNIAEKRLPQDGRFDVRIGNQEIDIRVSTIPTSFGERVVLRLLNKSGSLLKLTDIGLETNRLGILKDMITAPNGIILVTGPTGSGKTTSLYAILSHLNDPNINIITIEDPIEYQIRGINQIQVNPKIDLTFASGLRSIVRQDPDVILVGEIRDRETADIAVQSALTGHLVFSTLHTNDSASAITRLVDIGVEPFLISSSIVCVVAQRLIRVLCEDCKEPSIPDLVELDNLGINAEILKNQTIFKAVGCEKCFNTGYKGRSGIFEIMVMDDHLKTTILKTHDSNRIEREAIKNQMVTLRQDGLNKILNGVTTLEEVLRVTKK